MQHIFTAPFYLAGTFFQLCNYLINEHSINAHQIFQANTKNILRKILLLNNVGKFPKLQYKKPRRTKSHILAIFCFHCLPFFPEGWGQLKHNRQLCTYTASHEDTSWFNMPKPISLDFSHLWKIIKQRIKMHFKWNPDSMHYHRLAELHQKVATHRTKK